MLLKPLTAVKVCTKIAIRLVPFATGAGKPKNNKVGKVSNVPPPAIVFKNPAIKPIGINSKYSNEKSICENLFTNVFINILRQTKQIDGSFLKKFNSIYLEKINKSVAKKLQNSCLRKNLENKNILKVLKAFKSCSAEKEGFEPTTYSLYFQYVTNFIFRGAPIGALNFDKKKYQFKLI